MHRCFMYNKQAGPSNSVGCASDWYSGGGWFDPPVRQRSFVDIDHEIISTAILSSPYRLFKFVSYWRKNVY